MLTVTDRTWADLVAEKPTVVRYFEGLGTGLPRPDQTVSTFVSSLSPTMLDELALTADAVCEGFARHWANLEADTAERFVRELRIVGGRSKRGDSEDLDLVVRPGEVVCVVGPTGSGKSRLLADIECLAQGDTPTGRRVFVNGGVPGDELRFSAAHKLVAQLSQGMSYVLDLPVGEFVDLHARSRGVVDVEAACARVLTEANALCGEPFGVDDAVCSLSGGQSRALMIADVAFLSSSPVVLVDELENAGVDRRRALDLLVCGGKVVFVATHDPLLMLLGGRRVVMANGVAAAVVGRSAADEGLLVELEAYDDRLGRVREALRRGESAVRSWEGDLR